MGEDVLAVLVTLHDHRTSPAAEPGPIAHLHPSGAIRGPRVFARGSAVGGERIAVSSSRWRRVPALCHDDRYSAASVVFAPAPNFFSI